MSVLCLAMMPEAEGSTNEQPVSEEEWDSESQLWLARSCVGEAGWAQFDECIAIAWVYAARAKQSSRYTFLKMVRRYSAALQKGRSMSWVRGLNYSGRLPRGWPGGLRWYQGYRRVWKTTLIVAGNWAEGKHANPCPGANHFGGPMDHHRAVKARWMPVRCSVRMRNRFYTSLRLRTAY